MPLIAATPGKRIEFVSAMFRYNFLTAAYTGGGNLTIRYGNGANNVQASEAIAASNVTAANDVDSIVTHNDSASFSSTSLSAGEQGNTLNISGTAFTDPGTAAGTVNLTVYYRLFAD